MDNCIFPMSYTILLQTSSFVHLLSIHYLFIRGMFINCIFPISYTILSRRLPEGRVPAVSLNVSTLKRGLLVSSCFFEIFENI